MASDSNQMLVLSPLIGVIQVVLLVDPNLHTDGGFLRCIVELVVYPQLSLGLYVVFQGLMEAINELEVTFEVFTRHSWCLLIGVAGLLHHIADHAHCEDLCSSFSHRASSDDLGTVLRKQILVLLKLCQEASCRFRVLEFLYQILLDQSLRLIVVQCIWHFKPDESVTELRVREIHL